MTLVENELAISPIAKALLNKIENKKATIGVVGLGYVGLPLAVEKAKAGYKVIGFDIQEKRVGMVNKGENYIGDVIDSDLLDIVKRGKLEATTDYSRIKNVDAVAICVPTPLDKHQQPDITHVETTGKEITKHIHKGMLVILESTTYPGTTEDVLKPLLEESGLKVGEEIFLAYSPERVDPGNKLFNTKNTPKVVGGVTQICTSIASLLYKKVLDGEVHEVSSPAIAEMEKILENTFRNINIALANEMAILCNKMGIDVWEVIDAAATKPYGFMPFYPGPGIGGHCIPIDPFYLTWKAREYKYHTRLIETAAEINNYMPEFVVERMMKILNEEKKSLKGSKVHLLGVAYKKDIDDLRESPALEIISLLKRYGAIVSYSDPFIPSFMHNDKKYLSQEINLSRLNEKDIVLIITDHTDVDYNLVTNNSKIVFDTKNALNGIENKKCKYYKL